jgi:hypothetical protein
MQTATKSNSGAPAWVWKFCFCLLGGAAYVAAVIYLSGLFEQTILWLAGCGAVLWSACAWMGWRRAPMAELTSAITGLVWGGMGSVVGAMQLAENPAPINWGGLAAVLVLAPVALLITILPFWFMARKPAAPTN